MNSKEKNRRKCFGMRIIKMKKIDKKKEGKDISQNLK